MAEEIRPLSQLVSQGWEVLTYSSGHDAQGAVMDCFLLRRQKLHKVLKVRKKLIGAGFVVVETDV